MDKIFSPKSLWKKLSLETTIDGVALALIGVGYTNHCLWGNTQSKKGIMLQMMRLSFSCFAFYKAGCPTGCIIVPEGDREARHVCGRGLCLRAGREAAHSQPVLADRSGKMLEKSCRTKPLTLLLIGSPFVFTEQLNF
jgi:hypothetical protein